MANKVLDWVWTHSQSRHAARLVLLSLADSMHTENGWTWPSGAALMCRTGLGQRAVRSAVAELVALGELEVEYKAGRAGCNRYRVIMAHSADIAQSRDGADIAQSDRSSPQVTPYDGADIAPPRQILHSADLSADSAKFAPGTHRTHREMSSTKTSTARRRPKHDPDFDQWYAAYPVHKGRGDAERAWAQAMRDGAEPDTLIAAAKNYAQEPQVLRGYGKYPATWIRAKCWLDEAAPSPMDRATAQAAAIKARIAAQEKP